MLTASYLFIFLLVLCIICEQTMTKKRDKRTLVYTYSTQFGVYVAISIPLETQTLVSLAYFFEAQYYVVDNATWFDPLLGDFYSLSRSREDRSIESSQDIVTRKSIYIFIESMLEKNGYPGKACLLRAICENAEAHFLHNGILGDTVFFVLTPSSSMSEDDIEDCYYEAEYHGLSEDCDCYIDDCPSNPLDNISIPAEF